MQTFADKKACIAWFRHNHALEKEIWITIAKKGTGVTTATYEEAREAAIMYGWIDGLTHTVDATYYTIRFTPRRPKSNWSAINKAIAEELIAAGAMQPAGLAEVERARQDGRWQ